MRIRNLNSFIKVATLGSFHAAATQLHTSQPAISARIATLEEELGVRLFKRDQSGTQLTTRGMQLLPYAERLVAITNEMKSQLNNKAPEEGIFRIGIADTVAHLWLTDLLKVWREQHPMIQFELTIDLSQALYKELQEHRLDLAFMVYSDQGSINTQPLCAYPQSWVATPEFAAQHAVTSIHDLALLPILSFPIHTGPGRHLQQLFKDQPDMPKLHTSNSVAGLLAMAEQGAGVALLTDPLVQPAINAGRLQKLCVHPEAPLLHFCSGWRQDEDRILPQLLADSASQLIQSPFNPGGAASIKDEHY
ncbi:MAG: LysR family transcriptional regulator [Gammaproteobacteria bacterium]|jgi:DNA-binding transcriptional LysR family regulator|nr:LysR family transcriptional regulator [Gammaproteobacteria bacterium]